VSSSDFPEEGVPEEIVPSEEALQAALRLAEEACTDVLFDRTPTRPCGAFYGEKLFTETMVRPMTVEDISGDVRKCYEATTITDEALIRLRPDHDQPILDTSVQEFGMLNIYDVPPYATRPKKGREDVVSERERLRSLLTASAARRWFKSRIRPTCFEGRVLVARENPSEVLAWLTYWRSQVRKVCKRNQQNDESVARVHSLLTEEKEGIQLHAGLRPESYTEREGEILLFDTINSLPDAGGAATLLLHEVLPEWTQHNYRAWLMYRHKYLQICECGKLGRVFVPWGNNDPSEQFFTRLGCREIGTRLNNDQLAVRQLPKAKGKPGETEEVHIASTEGWMLGELPEAQRRLVEMINTSRQRFGLPAVSIGNSAITPDA